MLLIIINWLITNKRQKDTFCLRQSQFYERCFTDLEWLLEAEFLRKINKVLIVVIIIIDNNNTKILLIIIN